MFGMHGRRGCGPHGFYAMWGHHGGRHGWGRGMGREGGRRRMFDTGELRLVLLKLIADTPRHGYDLIKDIEERTGGAYAPSPGVIYPTLTLLDDMGLIAEEKSEGAKKLFGITEDGKAYLAERADEADALLARLDAIGSERARTDGAPIRRAMGNLRAVLQHRMTEGEVTQDTLHDVAAIIDEAARRIERL